jgi:hypothetical protein
MLITVILRTRVEYAEQTADEARSAESAIAYIGDESEWNSCFIIYTRSGLHEFTDFPFRIFSIFFHFVYVFIFALSADYLNFKNSFANL